MMVAGMVLVRRWNERRMVNEEMNGRSGNVFFFYSSRKTREAKSALDSILWEKRASQPPIGFRVTQTSLFIVCANDACLGCICHSR